MHGVVASNPVAIGNYNPATATPGIPNYDAGNAARQFIVPPKLSTGPVRIGIVLAAAIGVAVAVVLSLRKRSV